MNQHINDDSNDRKYFIITPQLVWALCRDPYEFTLWSVIKMIAAEHGECFLSTRKLAKMAMMSIAKTQECRSTLLDIGLLRGELKPVNGTGQAVWHLTIPDIWHENIEWRQNHHSIDSRLAFKAEQKSVRLTNTSERSPDEQERSPDEQERSPDEQERSPGSDKEEPVRKTQKEKPKKIPSPSQQMFSALRELCGYDDKVFPRGKLNQSEKKLRDAGISPGDLQGFGEWWYKNDWRGQKDQPPTPAQVVEMWGQYKANGGKPNGHSNITGLKNSNRIQKRVDVKAGRTYWYDTVNSCEVAEPV